MNTTDFIKQKFNITEQKAPYFINISRFNEFPKLLKELGYKIGAEIGVSRGFYSKCLFIRMRDLKLYLIDPWVAYDEYVEQHDYNGQIRLNECLEKAKERLKGFNCEFIQKTSMEAVKDFKDESLDFIFIDGNHSIEYVVEDIAKWSKKVKKGGIVAGHDYWNSFDRQGWADGSSLKKDATQEEIIKLCQAKDAVDAWTKTNQIKDWFVINKDASPSWFYVNE